MRRLSEQEIETIEGVLKEGRPLTDDHREDLIEQLEQLKRSLLFDTKREYELLYADKEREVDILADTMAVPLQKVKTFWNGADGNGWTNMLIFGDNLQVLKTLMQMKEEGKLKNADGTPGVRLVYIDPPFATRREFKGSQDQKAYQDKIAGAKFLEFLRKRLVFLRELLSEDGSIYVHLDWKKGHYVKTIMDEIFGEQNLEREIIWALKGAAGYKSLVTGFVRGHDTILYYSKNGRPVFSKEYLPYSEEQLKRFTGDKDGRKFKSITKDKVIYLDEAKGVPVTDVWTDIASFQTVVNAPEITGYPTQKPEALLERIIRASSRPGDLVMDCFAGSGTTQAVAEKLGMRWIGVECGKLAIYTMQKRLLKLREQIGNKGKPLKAKPFTLYNAGLYDYKMIKELPWEQYREFALKLFQCRDERHEISRIELDGYLGADSVLVFNYQEHKDAVMDRGFVDDLHRHLGSRIGRRFFIIAPAASVMFLEDYIEKGKTRYFVLRIPYSIIEEIHKRGFTKIKQPVSEMDVNDTVDAVGFDFVQVPTAECKYYIQNEECAIKIEKFESKVISRKPLEFANLETLSMVMLDYDFDGGIFDLDEVFYAEDLKKNGYEVRFSEDEVGKQIMVIYIDIFGNEKREAKTLSDFNSKRKK